MKKTLVIGATPKTDRYANMAAKKLSAHGHSIELQGKSAGKINEQNIDIEKINYNNIDTITLYVGPQNQAEWQPYIKALKPKRVIFNPGTENPAFQAELESLDIKAIEACTLVMLQTGQY